MPAQLPFQPNQFCTFSRILITYLIIGVSIISILSCSKDGSTDVDPVNGGTEKDGEISIVTNFLKDSILYITDADLHKDGNLVFVGQLHNSAPKVYRLNSSGEMDPSFNIDKDLTWLIQNFRQVQVLDDGSVLIAGQFKVGGKTKHLLKLQSDGKLDKSFDAPSFSDRGNTETSPILFMDVQSDGKIMLGGYFTSIGSSSKQALARLNSNGSLDESFKFDPTVAYSVIYNVEFLSGGKMLASGEFLTTVNPRRYVTRLNSDGSADASFIFREQLGGGIPAPGVYKTVSLPDGKILMSGFFFEITNPNVRDGKHLYSSFAQLNSDGSPNLNFEKMDLLVSGGTIKSIAPLPNEKILLGRTGGPDGMAKDTYFTLTDKNGKFERNLKLSFRTGSVQKLIKINEKKYYAIGLFGTQYLERTTPLLVLEVK